MRNQKKEKEMKRNARLAFNELKKQGVHVLDQIVVGVVTLPFLASITVTAARAITPVSFLIFTATISVRQPSSRCFLDKHGLYFEWCNAGVASVHDC